MSDLFSTVVEFFDQDEWPHIKMEGETMLRTRFEGEQGAFDAVCGTLEEGAIVFFQSFLQQACPPAQRSAMMELVTRINFGLYLGAFEMDVDDGEVRFKTSVDVEGVTLTTTLVRNLIYVNCSTMDRYLPSFTALLEEGASSKEALSIVEGDA